MRADNFPYYRDQIFDLYNDRKYREALAVAFQAKEKFPERRAKTSYWIGCLQSRLGESEEALQTLEKASKEGIWWPDQALLMEPDLESLQSRPEFKAIVAESQRIKQRALSRAKPGVMVLTPRNFSPEERHSLVIAVAMSDWVAPENKPASQRDHPSEEFASFIRAKDVRGLKGVVIMGEKDTFLPKIKMILEGMVERGFNCKIDVVQNLGHEFPVDFDRRLESATNFLLS